MDCGVFCVAVSVHQARGWVMQTSVTEQLCGAYCRCLCGLDDQSSSVSASVVRLGPAVPARGSSVRAPCAWLGGGLTTVFCFLRTRLLVLLSCSFMRRCAGCVTEGVRIWRAWEEK